jgi:hypothetical protein
MVTSARLESIAASMGDRRHWAASRLGGGALQPPQTHERNIHYVPMLDFQHWWAREDPCLQRDVSLPDDRHLNRARVLVLLSPKDGPTLQAEMQQHEARRATRGVHDFQPGKDYEDLTAATNEEKDDNDDDVPSTAVKKDTFLPSNYDEEAAIARALEELNAEEEAKWSCDGLDEVTRLTTMLAEHNTSLPPPPSLPPHAPPLAAWVGQLVPPPPPLPQHNVTPAQPVWLPPPLLDHGTPEYPLWAQHGPCTSPRSPTSPRTKTRWRCRRRPRMAEAATRA